MWLICSSGSANAELPSSAVPPFPRLNARAEAAVSKAAAAANNTVAANRSCLDRNMGFPLPMRPHSTVCTYSLGGKAFSALPIDFVEERGASATSFFNPKQCRRHFYRPGTAKSPWSFRPIRDAAMSLPGTARSDNLRAAAVELPPVRAFDPAEKVVSLQPARPGRPNKRAMASYPGRLLRQPRRNIEEREE